MDMAASFHDQRTFFSTGHPHGRGVKALDPLHTLRPALFAGYRDLSLLRYDFPVVLVAGGGIRSLSSIVDEALVEVAPRGIEGERLRKHALSLEREIRRRVAAGEAGLLSELWNSCAQGTSPAVDEVAQEVLRYTTAALKLDGEIVGCDDAMPARFVGHLWQAAHARKTRAFRRLVDSLIARLSDILRAAYIHSAAGQAPDALRASLGGTHQAMFDFDAMSKLVGHRAPADELSPARRRRIEQALDVLRRQRFYPDPRSRGPGPGPFEFRFATCAQATRAFRARLPAMVATVKAIAVAELEADGRYAEADHDPFFETFGDHALGAEDVFLFPDYLICVPADQTGAPENVNLTEALSSGLPLKVVVETQDVIEETGLGRRHYAFGVKSTRLAMTAMGLGGVFVVQTPSANLPGLRERVEQGLAHRGPALFCVYDGAVEPAPGISPYLAAAAAVESRAFPPFSYDPLAGDNLAARFSLENCPQPEADWPVEALDYADAQGQRASEPVAFTFADFALCDRRYAAHFAMVPDTQWSERMRCVADWLDLPPKDAAESVPFVWAIDGDDVLHRLVVDARIADATRRCRTLWHRLREQGGIHNSHAERLLARERAAWEADKQREIEALKATIAAAGAAPAATAPAASIPEAQPAAAASPAEAPTHSPDEAWIETSRCPSCNECQLINDRMFLYNENKQAYIGDLKAGTYRQMIEAAESCQVSIIHPGKPLDPGEPGLDELIERARPFLEPPLA